MGTNDMNYEVTEDLESCMEAFNQESEKIFTVEGMERTEYLG
ncbi:MAG: hypothetical protein QMB63_00435 [Clostridiaceae bacterium]